MNDLRTALKAILRDKLLCVVTVGITALVLMSLLATPSPWYVWVGLLSYYPVFVLFTSWLDVNDKRWLYPGLKDEEADS